MAHGKDMGYSIFRIFVVLFVLTAVEVAWGMFLREPRWLLWTGLLVCAVWKGLLILMYFMHMRFEKMIVWSLILPTPALIAVVMFANMPDSAFNERRDYPVGYLIDQSGEVVNGLDPEHPAKGRGKPHGHSLAPAKHHGEETPAPAGH